MCGMTTNSLHLKRLGSYPLHPRKGWIVGPYGRGCMALKSESSIHSSCEAPSWGDFRDAVRRLPFSHPSHWLLSILDLWKIQMPGHLPGFSHLVSQKGNQISSTVPLLYEGDLGKGHISRIQESKNPQTSHKEILISHSAYLNSGANHRRLWKTQRPTTEIC